MSTCSRGIKRLIDVNQARFDYLQASLERDLSEVTLADMEKLRERIASYRKILWRGDE